MEEEGPSNPGNPNGQAPVNGQAPKAPQEAAARYDVGPGFEIAIRSDADRPLEVTLKGEREGGRPPTKGGEADHRHDSVEKRLDAIERSILLLAQHIQRLDERLSGGTGPRPQEKP